MREATHDCDGMFNYWLGPQYREVDRGMTKTSATGCLTKPSPRRFALLFYFVGAYAWTWCFSLLKILAQREIISIPVPFMVLDIAAGLGPLVAALAATSYESGGEGGGR